MSWSLVYTDGVRGDHSLKDLNSLNLQDGLDFGDSSEEVVEQVDQAKAMANFIIESEVVGSPDKVFSVSLSGHANLNHEPKEGWANDMISVQVVQR
jgi:hypothetical protein